MRAWLCKIICGSTKMALEPLERAIDDSTHKTNSIKRRIAAMESRIGRYKQSNQNPSAQTKQLVVKKERSKNYSVRTGNEKQKKDNSTNIDLLKTKLMRAKK